MRLYQLGDVGPAIRDIQARLEALGFVTTPDLKGSFADGTREAVSAFQQAKGIDQNGVVGPDTWRSLYEAGYRLGDRLAFLRRPMMRGEDVADLQSRLGSLGFDPGKVDGIFGPKTEAAVIDFQHNRGLAEDGKVGPEVITELRLVTRGAANNGRQAIREREWLRGLTPTLAGAKVFLDAGCRDPDEACRTWEVASAAAQAIQDAGGLPIMSRSEDAQTTERVRAQRANRLGSDVIVAIRMADDEDQVYYFASEHSHSEAGEELAAALAVSVGGAVVGRAGVILTETRAPAAVVAHTVLDDKLGVAVAEGLDAFFRTVATRP